MTELECTACGLVQERSVDERMPWCVDCGVPLVLHVRSGGAEETQEERLKRTTGATTDAPKAGGELPIAYAQNPEQSGDTMGVSVALILHPERFLLFCVCADELKVAAPYLDYYRAMGITRERIALAVCDVSTDARAEDRQARQDVGRDLTKLDARIAVEENRRTRQPAAGRTETEQRMPAQRLKDTRSLLERQLVLRANREERAEIRRRAALEASAQFREHISVLFEWDHFQERGDNQIYQDVVNLRVRTSENSSHRRALQDLFRSDSVRISDIGTTTREVSSYVKANGVAAAVKSLRAVVERLSSGAVDTFARKFATELRDAQPSIRLGSRRITVVLLWIRGLNGAEATRVHNAGIQPNQVKDSIQRQLDRHKRNPHHVMTAQLYETISYMAKSINNKRAYADVNGSRWLVLVPIGDEVRYDWYRSSGEGNVHVGPAPSNLIRFWERLAAFKGSRAMQLAFIHALSKQLDVVQIGIRSGALEQGMYLGLPTIYLEEQGSPSGARMASLARDLDPKLRIATSGAGDGKSYSMFFRLITRHLIGLNQARDARGLEEFESGLTSNTPVDERLLKGSLTESELTLLTESVAQICRGYEAWKLSLG